MSKIVGGRSHAVGRLVVDEVLIVGRCVFCQKPVEQFGRLSFRVSEIADKEVLGNLENL